MAAFARKFRQLQQPAYSRGIGSFYRNGRFVLPIERGFGAMGNSDLNVAGDGPILHNFYGSPFTLQRPAGPVPVQPSYNTSLNVLPVQAAMPAVAPAPVAAALPAITSLVVIPTQAWNSATGTVIPGNYAWGTVDSYGNVTQNGAIVGQIVGATFEPLNTAAGAAAAGTSAAGASWFSGSTTILGNTVPNETIALGLVAILGFFLLKKK